jgi:hypothetical protein
MPPDLAARRQREDAMEGTTINHECGRIHADDLLREAERDRRSRKAPRTRRPERDDREGR